MSLSASHNAWAKLQRNYQHNDPALSYLLLPYVVWLIEIYRVKVRWQNRFFNRNMALIMAALEETERRGSWAIPSHPTPKEGA